MTLVRFTILTPSSSATWGAPLRQKERTGTDHSLAPRGGGRLALPPASQASANRYGYTTGQTLVRSSAALVERSTALLPALNKARPCPARLAARRAVVDAH